MPTLSVIAAMARNRVIGLENRIPWHLPDELKLFKAITMGHHIIMGRKTWESIGRLLPGRTTVIVTRQPHYAAPGAKIARSLDDAIFQGAGDPEVFVIGGAELYRMALPVAHRLHLTTVDAEPEGDTWMPAFEMSHWREVSATEHAADERNPFRYRHAVYERIRA